MIKDVNCCWGDPDSVMYTVEGEDEIRKLNLEDNGYVFGIWDGVFVMGDDNDDTASLLHDDFLLYYIYYNGWPKRDIIPIKDIDERNGWDYYVAKNIPVEYDNYSYYDDDENVLPEYQMTYGDLLKKLGRPKARGRVLVDHNNGWIEFVAFWGEPTLEEKKLVYKNIGNPYVVVFNNVNEAKEFYLHEGNKVFTFKEWIQSGKYIPRIKKDENAYQLHLMNAKNKWNNTVTFRDVRDAKNAKKLGDMTMAQYNSLKYQENRKMEKNVINETDASRKFKNLISISQLIKKIAKHGYKGKYTEQAIYRLLDKYGIKAKTSRGGKSYFNKSNACTCIDRHIFELKEMAEQLEQHDSMWQKEPELNVSYGRNNMSNTSNNDGVFGVDENVPYKNESRKVIRISEDKLRLFEINTSLLEGTYDWDAWGSLEGGVGKRPYRKRTTTVAAPKRKVVNSFYDAKTVNQIGRTLRKAWDSMKLRAIVGYNRNITRIYGRSNADAIYNFFNENGENMFAKFAEKYNTISRLTSDIEKWARESDGNGVDYRLRDLPKNLEELALMLNGLFNKYKQLKRVRQFSPMLNGNGNAVGNMIDGYKTTNGLSDLVIAKTPKEVAKIADQLNYCAEYIREMWGDNLENGSVKDGSNKIIR